MENEANITAENGNQKPMGTLARMINIFWEPSKVFEYIKSKPSWVAPWILISVFAMIGLQLTWSINIKSQLEKIRNTPGITVEQMQTIEDKMGDPNSWSINRTLATVGAPIGILVVFVVVAAALYFTGSVIGGGNSTFKHNLAAYSHASLIGILGTIVTVFLVKIKGTLDISLSPAIFLPASMYKSFIYNFLNHFEFFTIWAYILTSIGFATIYGFSKAKAYISVGVLWLIWILLTSALTNTFSGLYI